MNDFEMVSLAKDKLSSEILNFESKKELKKFVLESDQNKFLLVENIDFDLDYFLKHSRENTVGLSLKKGPYILQEDGSIKEKSTDKYVDGYDLSGQYFLTKERLLDFLEDKLDITKQFGIPLGLNKNKDKRPALFLDRDGVVNVDKGYVFKIDQLTLYEEIIPIIKFANDNNWWVIILTNQSGIGRGLFTEADVEILHSHIISKLKENGASIDGAYFSPYHEESGIGEYKKFSHLRKPYPGLALKAMEDFPIDIDRSIMIGDKVTDELFLPGLTTFHIQRDYELKDARSKVFSSLEGILEKMSGFLD